MGLGYIILGLAMAVREAAKRKHADALSSAGLSVLGALLLTGSVLEDGGASYTILAGIILVAGAMRLGAQRLSRQQGG
jgi:hypothetical protein